MGILGVFLNDLREILNSSLMLIYHLIRFRSFMHKPDVRRDFSDSLGVREDGLLESLEAAEREANMVVHVCFIGQEWLRLNSLLHSLDTSPVLLIGIVHKAKLVVQLRILLFSLNLESCV